MTKIYWLYVNHKKREKRKQELRENITAVIVFVLLVLASSIK